MPKLPVESLITLAPLSLFRYDIRKLRDTIGILVISRGLARWF